MYARIESLETRRLMAGNGNTTVDIGAIRFFVNTDSAHGNELWKSDLNGSNASLVKDLYPGTGSSSPAWLTSFNGKLYFVAGDKVVGTELFESDGTEAGTKVVKDLYDGSYPSRPDSLTVVGSQLYFVANGKGFGKELFVSDGTTAGTHIVQDIYEGTGNANPVNFINLDGRLIFQAQSGAGNSRKMQLYSTTGNGAVKLFSAPGGGQVYSTSVEGDTLFFTARRYSDDLFQLWQSDGTLAGTEEINPPPSASIPASSGDDLIEISTESGTTFVKINGVTTEFDEDSFSQLNIFCGDGNDTVTVDADYILPLAIYGEAGDDLLASGRGADTLVGGSDHDTLLASAGNDVLIGGDGNDTIDYSARGGAIQTDYQGPSPDADLRFSPYLVGATGERDRFEEFETLIGTQAADLLNIWNADDTYNNLLLIDGSGGDDHLDYYAHSTEEPTLHGGDGNDTLTVQNQKSYSYPSDNGFDINVIGLPAILFGDDGNDTFIDRSSANDYHGGDGIDTLDYSSLSTSTFHWIGYRWIVSYTPRGVKVTPDDQANDGKWGQDNVRNDIEKMIGSAGPDELTMTTGPGTLLGGTGNDTLTGNGADVVLDGGAGSNQLIDPPPGGASGSIVNRVLRIVGTSDNDQISLRENGAILEVILNSASTNFTRSDFDSIRIDGLDGNDNILLNYINVAAKIYGGAGNDVIYGSNLGDRISGGDGNDWISAGQGNDTLYGDAGNDRLFGGDGMDYLYGGAGANVFRSGAGHDRIIGQISKTDRKANIGDIILSGT